MRIPEPVLNEDFYMVKLTGGDVALPAPRTRFEELLYIYAGGTIERPTPKTVEERFLDYITGGESELPTPKTRLQSYMYNVANPLNKIPIVSPKTRFECYWFVLATANQWESVQRIVRNGTASKIFPIGTKMYCRRGHDILEWDVIGVDHDTPTDPQFTHSLTLQLHYCFPTPMQFDAPEAFYYAENGLEAKTYHFTVGSTDYQFTLESDITAESQLILNFTGTTPTSIFVSETVGGDFVKDTNGINNLTIAVTPGSGGDELTGVNNIARVRYGSNNYKESAIRQWLNSSAVAGSVWAPQTNFDRPPLWAENTAGFMNGMDADFLGVIGKTAKVTVRNTVTDGGGYDETDDYFFLLSRSEVYGGAEVNSVNEGTAYPYYSDNSYLDTPGTGNDSNRVKYLSGTPTYWWDRTPYSGDGITVRIVNPTGGIGGSGANNSSYGAAPGCNII